MTTKPYLDYDIDLNLELMDVINLLKSDPDKEVADVAEQTDYTLLHQKKKNKEEEKSLLQLDNALIESETQL